MKIPVMKIQYDELISKKCKPCEGGVPPLNPDEIKAYKEIINGQWRIIDNKKITREFAFINFKHTMDFVNKVALLAEEEGHHPVMHIDYAKLIIELWTHAINGLSENDFILAAKIDTI